jgi:hypothetical protein
MPAFSELRLIASPQGFAVYDAARKKLAVLAIDVMIRPGNPPLMSVALPAGPIDVVGKPIFAVVDPASGQPRVVRRIEWADGTTTDFPAPEKAADVFNGKQAPAGPGPATGSLPIEGQGQVGAPGREA